MRLFNNRHDIVLFIRFFRFGTVPYKSKKVTRRLKVINTSVVPLTISWHMFVNLHGARKAFSLLFDMPDTELLQFSEELVKGHLFLTNKYFGEPNTCHFEVSRYIHTYLLIGNWYYRCRY